MVKKNLDVISQQGENIKKLWQEINIQIYTDDTEMDVFMAHSFTDSVPDFFPVMCVQERKKMCLA